MTESYKQHAEEVSSSPRYRVGFFDYQHDFAGKHNYRGPSYGYFTPEDSLVVPGWVVPDIVEGRQSLQLQVIQGGEVLQCETVSFLPSEDVHKQYPDLEQAAEARYKINFPLHFLENDEYVLRFCLLEGRNIKARLWDLAYIRDEVLIKPIFVVGSPRAGTTAVGNALREALGAKNYGEHHFLFLAKKMEDTISEYFRKYHTRNDKGTFINDISPALVKVKMSQQIKELYASWQPGGYFVDKTPGRNMLKSIPNIQQIWPEAKYVFCKRRAYENVKSRLVKFPHLTVEQHAKQWVEVMQSWREIRRKLPEGSYIEVDQHDLRGEAAAGLVDKMSEVLQIDSEEVYGYIASKSPQKSNYSGGNENMNGLEETVSQICSDEMVKWAYSNDHNGYY
ncbi:sulfotransferase [Synechocystis sp. LEGE 06083]|uniref:sulfotransferase n=1 Tax=Synechocystis sp. LEGE 06083 TaxID=915336 RepID=UPI00187EFDB5|nr:sulfotransferase [Synechocystis sp. LEGE 06083]MBE9197279.1 sulfotransferase [Synechocystis sp. LEGE 06083]